MKREKIPGRNDLVRCLVDSPHLNPLDFYFWIHMKIVVYFQVVDELAQECLML